MPVGFFFFEIFEETFAAGVIKRISLFGEGLDNIQFIKQFSKCKGCVLWSSIRVKHQSSWTVSGIICFLKGLDDQIRIGFGWYIPGDNLSGKKIHNDTKIIPLTSGFEIRKITCPDQVGSFLMKVLMQVISITTRRLFWARNGFWFYCGHRWKLHGTHQAVHSTDADTNAIVTT